jgi:hypothetical protein
MKVLSIRVIQIGLITVLVGGTIGCSPMGWLNWAWSSPPAISIKDIPQKKNDRIIYLKGKVIDRVPFIDSGSYQLQDATGTLWILTNKELPAIGAEIVIKGQIEYQPIPIGRQDLGEFYVLELEKLSSSPESTANSPPNSPNNSNSPTYSSSPPSPPNPSPSPEPFQPNIMIPVPVAPEVKPNPTPSPKPTSLPAPKPSPSSAATADTKPTPSTQPAQPTPDAKPTPKPITQPQTQSQTKPQTKLTLDDNVYFPHKRNSK